MQRQTKAEFYESAQHQQSDIWPEHWPEDVRVISTNGLALLGLDGKGNLYLDGERLYTAKRLATQERALAWIVTAATVLGAVATAWPHWFHACQ